MPPTPGSELKKRMQNKEEETRAGGRENYPIKIIETAGRTLEQTLVNTDPFGGNLCNVQTRSVSQQRTRKTKSAVDATAFVIELLAFSAWRLDGQLMSRTISKVPATMVNRQRTCTVEQKSTSRNSTARVKRFAQNQHFTNT